MKVLVTEKIADLGIEKLKKDFEVDIRTDLTPEELKQAIKDYDALIIRSATKVTEGIIGNAPKLKIVGRAGIGLDNVDVDAATRRGIMVANAPQSNIISAAEHTIALLLAQARSIPRAHFTLKAGKWQRSKFEGVEVFDKVLGIIGLGRVGSLVAARAKGLGMKVIAYDPYVPKDRFADLEIEMVKSLEELLKEADFITIHLPKTAETRNIIDKEKFALMKDGVRITNTARGGIVNEKALYEAIKSGKVAGAALDVFETEPVTDSPLFKLDEVVVTPHLGASTSEAQDKAGIIIAEQVVAALKGEFVSNAVNIPAAGAEVLKELRPFLPLAEMLGKLYTHFAQGRMGALDIEYAGDIAQYDVALLTVAVLKGLFEPIVLEPVTYVNASLLARDRGIEIREVRTRAPRDYTNLITLKGENEEGKLSVAGTLIGKRNEPRLVKIYDFDMDISPSKYMAFFRYADRPGVIGAVGTTLGKNNINIGTMQVGRDIKRGEAVMGINVDSPIPQEILDEIRKVAHIKEAKFITF